jgi:hypothetical protein
VLAVQMNFGVHSDNIICTLLQLGSNRIMAEWKENGDLKNVGPSL